MNRLPYPQYDQAPGQRGSVKAVLLHPYKIWPGHPLECFTCGHHRSNWRHWAKRCPICDHWSLRLPFQNPADSFFPRGKHCKKCEAWLRYGS
jgi:hypothetical protein